MLDHIRDKTFDPDLTRSGRFAKRTLRVASAAIKEDGYSVIADDVLSGCQASQSFSLQPDSIGELNVDSWEEDAKSDVDSTSESSSSSSGSEAEGKDLEILAKRKAPEVTDPAGSSRLVCKTSQLLHLLLSSTNSRFRCGRTVSKNYQAVDRFKESMLAVCTQCFPTVSHR